MSESQNKIILNIDKEYLQLLKDEYARKLVREVLKDLDILIKLNEDEDSKNIINDIIQLKDRLKDRIYEGFKNLYMAIESHSAGIDIIQFIEFRLKSNKE